MSTIDIGKIQATTRNTALGMLGLLLALTACTPSTPQTGGTSPAAATSPPAATSTATASAPATSTASPSASATVPADTDETAPPHSGVRVISSKITLDWTWPGPGSPFRATHENPVPIAPPPAAPLPALYAIGAGTHPAETPPYDQLSFRFLGGFPSYDIEFVPKLIADGSGLPISMPGTGAILKVVFRGAQAHTDGRHGQHHHARTWPGARLPGAHQLRRGRGLRGRRQLWDRRGPADGSGARDQGAGLGGREDRAGPARLRRRGPARRHVLEVDLEKAARV